MTNAPEDLELVNISQEKRQLMDTARAAGARRAGRTIYHGDGLRHTIVALLQDAEMAEHESPREAFLHVLDGQIQVVGQNRTWDIGAGELFPVPPEKHAVIAVRDSVFTLTVLRDAIVYQ